MRKPDLFTPDEAEAKRAQCGFLPMGGWPHKWARKAHLDNCDDCLRIEGNGQLSKREERRR
jgi:hypothetical protein